MFSGSIMDKAGVSCYECHRYVKVYESALYPRITGHTFEPRPEQCVSSDCHPGKDAKWAKEAVRVGQNEIRMLFKEAEEKVAVVNSVLSKMYPTWDGSKESIMDIAPPTTLEGVDKYLKAEFNVEFVKADRSWGFHNREKAKRMLEEVEPLTEEALELISQEVLGAVGERPEVPPPRGVCGPIAVLLLAVLPLFIIRLREGR
jgi:formate-dependent nitrite reductase cytochrome c552 subunit